MENRWIRLLKAIATAISTLLLTACITSQQITAAKKNQKITCESLEHCLSLISSVGRDRAGSISQERQFAEEFKKFGDDALPPLLELIYSDDIGDSKIAGYAIRSFDHIDEKYLDDIMTAINNDVGGITIALSAIKTNQAAITAVNLYLNDPTPTSSKKSYLIKKLGERAIPHLIKSALCESYCFHYPPLFSDAAAEMNKPNKLKIADLVFDHINKGNLSTYQQEKLLLFFNNIGPLNIETEDHLISLQKKYPQLKESIDEALLGTHSRYSGKILSQRLSANPNTSLLFDIAEIGKPAKEAGPAIVELLEYNDRRVTLFSARTLGYISYEGAEKALTTILTNSNDIKLVWTATTSLGMIGLKSSIPALESFGLNHWHPAIRKAANRAISIIQDTDNDNSGENFNRSTFFDIEYLETKNCKNTSLTKLIEAQANKLYPEHAKDELGRLAHTIYVVANDPTSNTSNNYLTHLIIEPEHTISDYIEKVEQTPNVALKTPHGWLTGSDRGEFGGELIFINTKGKKTTILRDNVEDIYKFGNSYIIVSGLSHFSFNNGTVYSAQYDDNSWKVEPWIHLPGSPLSSYLVDTGEVLINTSSGGSLLISMNGNIRMAPCRTSNQS